MTELEPIKTSARIVSCKPLNHDIIELTLELESALSYRPGQYARLTVPKVAALTTAPRSYSFASGANDKATTLVQFHIRKVANGAFTEWLFGADRIDEKLEVLGPFGDFCWHDQPAKPLFIAGGSGFSPIKALLEQCIEAGRPLDAVLIYGARTREDVYCMVQVGALQKRWSGNLTFIPVLSNEASENDWPGARGFVHEIISAPTVNSSERTAYICGPPPMIDACLDALSGTIQSDNIHYDKFPDRSHMDDLATG